MSITYTGLSSNTRLAPGDVLRLTFGVTSLESWLPSIAPVRASDFKIGMDAIYGALASGAIGVTPLTPNPATGSNENGTVDVAVPLNGQYTPIAAELVTALQGASTAWFGLFGGFVGVVRVQKIAASEAGDVGGLDAADEAAGRDNQPWFTQFADTLTFVAVAGAIVYGVHLYKKGK